MSENEFSDDSEENEFGQSYYSQNNRNVPFYGAVEKTKLVSQKENQAKLNRLNEVRKQERELAKQKRDQYKNAKQIEEDEGEKQRKLEEYVEKMRMIQELTQMKSLANQEIGMAHRRAEDVENMKKTRLQLEKEEKAKIEQITQERSKQAFEKQKKMDDDRYQAVHQYLERRKQVLETENSLAHKQAEQYRETNSRILKTQENEEQSSYDQYDKNVSRKTFSSKGGIDFSKSHLHNPIVVSHKNDLEVETALDKAKQEAEKTLKRQEEILQQKEDVQKKAMERAQKISQAEKSKKVLEEFDSEMVKLEKADKALKIQKGKTDPRTEVKPNVIKQNLDRIQEEAAKEFEDKFLAMKPTVSKPTITKGESNKYQDDLVEVIDGDGSKPLKKADDKKFSKNNSKENLKTKPINQKSTKKITPVPSTNENIKKSPKKPNEKKTVKLAEKSQNDYSESEDQAEKEYSARKNNNKKQIEDDYDDDYDNEKQVLQPIIPQPHSAISQNNPNIKVAEEFYSNSNPPNPQFVYQFPPNQFYPQQFPLQFNNFMMPPNPMFYPNQFVGQPFGYDNRFDGANNMNKNQNPYENGLERSDKKNNYNESRQESTKEPDSEIKNYIKEQEEFLQKLENDRKKLKDKLNNEQKPAEKPKPSHHSQPLQENIPSRSNEVYPPQNNRNQEQSKQRELDPKSDQKQKNRGRDERDELAELQRKTDELLEKFMNPADKGGSRSPPRNQYGYNNYHQESQNNYEDEEQEDDIEEYEESQTTPQKSDKKKFKSHGSSPISELNYSISEKDRSAMKSQNMSQTFERSKLMETEKMTHGYQTFGNKEHDDRQTRGNQKGWKMDFNQEEDDAQILINDGEEGQGVSLADMFKKNKKKIMERYEQQKERQKSEERENKGKRTKEEILKQRKEMMKPNLIKKNNQDEENGNNEREKNEDGYHYQGRSDKKGKKEPNPELLSRLAKGEKTKVDKKEMKALTTKNYELLPEVKRKREEEKKKEELKQRMQKSKELGKKIRGEIMSK